MSGVAVSQDAGPEQKSFPAKAGDFRLRGGIPSRDFKGRKAQ